MYLILCVFYDEVKIIKPLSSRNSNSERYLVCKGFQSDYIKNHIQSIKSCLFSIRPYHLLFPHAQEPNINKENIANKITNQMRILTEALPLYYISKMEEIQVLVSNKTT